VELDLSLRKTWLFDIAVYSVIAHWCVVYYSAPASILGILRHVNNMTYSRNVVLLVYNIDKLNYIMLRIHDFDNISI